MSTCRPAELAHKLGHTVNLLRGRGILVRSLSDGIDPATPTGRLLPNLLGILAEYERELIVERVNAGITAVRQSGNSMRASAIGPESHRGHLASPADARAKGLTAEEARTPRRLEPRAAVSAPASDSDQRDHDNPGLVHSAVR